MDLERARRQWEQAFESNVALTAKLTRLLRTDEAPEWVEARQRLEAAGVSVDGAVLTSLHSSGRHSTGGIVATPEGRVFDFDVVYGYDRDGRPLEKGIGWIASWDDVTDRATVNETWKLPSIYLEAVLIARRLLDAEQEQSPPTG